LKKFLKPSSVDRGSDRPRAQTLVGAKAASEGFTVDGGIGAKQRPFHGTMADAGDARWPHRIKFNLMGVGGLLTYLSFARIGGQPSTDRVFEEVNIGHSVNRCTASFGDQWGVV
jgi:hypothetical protein